jgi:hypothetical protein
MTTILQKQSIKKKVIKLIYRWIQGTVVLCCSAVFVGGSGAFASAIASPAKTQPSLAQTPPIPTTNSTSLAQTTPKVIILKSGQILRVKVDLKADLLPSPTETAVFLGDLDITAQIQREGQEFVYQSSLLVLPIGEQTLTIYRTTNADNWESIATFTVKIEADTPITTTPPATPSTSSSPNTPVISAQTNPQSFKSKFNVTLKSQIAESRSPDAGTSARPTSLDAAFTGELSAQYQIGAGKLKGKVNLVGTTFQPEALRFKELKESASLVDLTAYSIDFTDGDLKFAVGNVCFGNNSLLVNAVCTRGITGTGKLTNFADLTVGHLSTTSIVGFENILGIENSNNTLTAGTLGLQLMNNAAGGVRLETTLMNGSRLPIANFNVGEVVDAEKSDGIGFRLTAADDTGRWKADAGFARSTFTNIEANDPQLTQGANNVALQPVTKNAWYAETSYDIFKDIKLDDTRKFSLSANLKLEQTDPQFGTIGASTNPDRLQGQYGLNGTIAGASIQFQHSNSEDNIASIPNLLKTKSNSNTFSLNLPLQTVMQDKNVLIPTISYSYQQTAQNGSIALAANGNFDDPSKIPNQINVTQKFGLAWKFSDALSFDYKFGNTFQDNRQSGRENSDFSNLSHQFSVGWQSSQQLRFNLGYNFSTAQNIERQITRLNQSPSLGVSWEVIPDLNLAFNYNLTSDSDSIGESLTQANSLDLLLTWNFKTNTFGQENPGSIFLRYGYQSNLNRTRIGNINTDATINTIAGGLSLSF